MIARDVSMSSIESLVVSLDGRIRFDHERRMRLLLGIAALFLAAACGSAAEKSGSACYFNTDGDAGACLRGCQEKFSGEPDAVGICQASFNYEREMKACREADEFTSCSRRARAKFEARKE